MGCGAGSRKAPEQALEPSKTKNGATKETQDEILKKEQSNRPSLLQRSVTRAEGVVGKFSLTDSGSLECLSFYYSAKYSGKTKTLEILDPEKEYVVSDFFWKKVSSDGAADSAPYYEICMLDKECKVKGVMMELKTPGVNWASDLIGRYGGLIEREKLEQEIYAQQGKKIEDYSEAQRQLFMGQIDAKMNSMWNVYVENWIQERTEIDKEFLVAHGKDCVFMSEKVVEDPEKIRLFLMDKLQDSEQVKLMEAQCFAVIPEQHSLLSPKKQQDEVTFVKMEKIKEKHLLCLAGNRNPMMALKVEKKAIVFQIGDDRMFADVGVDCHMTMFKVPGITEDQITIWIKEETNNFKVQCKNYEDELVALIKSLNIPTSN